MIGRIARALIINISSRCKFETCQRNVRSRAGMRTIALRVSPKRASSTSTIPEMTETDSRK